MQITYFHYTRIYFCVFFFLWIQWNSFLFQSWKSSIVQKHLLCRLCVPGGFVRPFGIKLGTWSTWGITWLEPQWVWCRVVQCVCTCQWLSVGMALQVWSGLRVVSPVCVCVRACVVCARARVNVHTCTHIQQCLSCPRQVQSLGRASQYAYACGISFLVWFLGVKWGLGRLSQCESLQWHPGYSGPEWSQGGAAGNVLQQLCRSAVAPG